VSLSVCRLVLVSGHVVAGAGADQSLRSCDGRSYMYLPSIGFPSRWLGAPHGWSPARPRGVGRWAPARCWQSPCWWRVPTGRRRIGSTTRHYGGMRWHVPPITSRPNKTWPRRSIGKAAATRRSLIVGLPPKHAIDCWPFNGLGALLAREGKLDEAVAQYRQALAKNPTRTWCTSPRGRAGAAGAVRRSEQHFDRALEINRAASMPAQPVPSPDLQKKFDESPCRVGTGDRDRSVQQHGPE